MTTMMTAAWIALRPILIAIKGETFCNNYYYYIVAMPWLVILMLMLRELVTLERYMKKTIEWSSKVGDASDAHNHHAQHDAMEHLTAISRSKCVALQL